MMVENTTTKHMTMRTSASILIYPVIRQRMYIRASGHLQADITITNLNSQSIFLYILYFSIFSTNLYFENHLRFRLLCP